MDDPGEDPGEPGEDPGDPGSPPDKGPPPKEEPKDPGDPGSRPEPCDPKTGEPNKNFHKEDREWKAKSAAKDEYNKDKKQWDKWKEYNDKVAAKKEYEEKKAAHDKWKAEKEAYDAYLKALEEWEAKQKKKKGETEAEKKLDTGNIEQGNDHVAGADVITINSRSLNPAGVIGAGSDATFLERVVDLGSTLKWYPGNTRYYVFEQSGVDQFTGSPGTYREIERLRDGGGAVTGYQMVDAANNSTFFKANGQIDRRVDRNGNTKTFVYDGEQVIQIVAPSGQVVNSLAYYPSGRLKHVTNVAGATRTYCYDANACLLSERAPPTVGYPEGRLTKFVFSSGFGDPKLNGNLLRIIDPDDRDVVAFAYDSSDRAISETRGADTWHYEYAEAGGFYTTRVIDPRGAVSEYTWSAGANDSPYPVKVERFTNLDIRGTDPVSYLYTYSYDANFNVTKEVTPSGRRYDRTYDAGGNIMSVRVKATDTDVNSPADRVMTYTWGPNRQVTSYTNELGHVTTYTWNANGNLVRIDYPEVHQHGESMTPFATWTYNAAGQPLSHTDPDGTEYRWLYYAAGASAGRVQQFESGPAGSAEVVSWTYDAAGNVSTYTNAAGTVFSAIYDAENTLTEFVSPIAGQPRVRLTYNGRGMLLQTEEDYKDETGASNANATITRTYAYNSRGYVERIEEEIAPGVVGVLTFSYDPRGNLATKVWPTGYTVQYEYDERNLLFRVKKAPGTAVEGMEQLDYTPDGFPARHVAENGAVTEYSYDGLGRLVVQRNALGEEIRFSYDLTNAVTSVAVADSSANTVRQTAFLYDEMRNVTEKQEFLLVQPQVVYSTKYYHTASGILRRVVSPAGIDVFNVAYDAYGRLATVSMAGGTDVRTFTFDARGEATSVVRALWNDQTQAYESYRVDAVYDVLGRMTEQRVYDRLNPSQYQSTQWAYDSFGRMVREVRPDGTVANIAYCDGGPVRQVSRGVPGGTPRTTTFEYTGGRFSKAFDDNLVATEYLYDARDRLTTIKYADQTTETMTYAMGKLILQATDANGTVRSYTRDALGRPISCQVSLGTGVGGPTNESWTYDALGRVVLATNNSTTVSRTWDSLGRLTSETTGQNPLGGTAVTVAATYDAEGRVTGLTYPGGAVVAYAYGPAGEVRTVSRNGNALATYQYLGGTSVVGRTSGNGISSSFAYDGFLRTTTVSHSLGTGTLAQFSYGYTTANLVSYEQRGHLGGTGDNYSYDADNWLAAVLRGVANPPAEQANPGSQVYVQQVTYGLDGMVNRAAVTTTPYGGTPTSVPYSKNALNQYTAIGGVARSHDAVGNLKDDGTRLFTYDYRGRLLSVTDKATGASIVALAYDSLGRRYQKTTPAGGTTRFTCWADNVIEERVAGAVVRDFAGRPHGFTGDRILTSATGLTYYSLENGTGNVSHITDAAGAVVEEYRYSEFGAHSIHDGLGQQVAASIVGNPLRFQGRVLDSETGLYAYGIRTYDAAAGRFLQRDPAGAVDQSNLYSAFNHSPLAYTDYDGFKVVVEGNANFKSQANQALDHLKSTPTGKALYDNLDKSDKTYKIKEGTKNSFDPNDSNTIRFNPDGCRGPDKDTTGSDFRPPWVGLGHEMAHAVDYDDRPGFYSNPGSKSDGHGHSLNGNEYSASQTENKIRSEAGIPARATYGSFRLGN